ncbi:MAG TPA: hypothetical protein DDY91_23945, partial [Planctomycetaceae bacterium]|nr:hypothetical protein [Planctomycetaceae bacterium]
HDQHDQHHDTGPEGLAVKLSELLQRIEAGEQLPQPVPEGMEGQNLQFQTIASQDIAPLFPYTGAFPTYPGGPPSPFSHYTGCWAWVDLV